MGKTRHMSRSERARAGEPPLHILWLKTELLHPVDKGGKIRTYQMLRELRRSHTITYVTLDDGGAAPDAGARALEYCDQVVRIPFRQAAKGSPRSSSRTARAGTAGLRSWCGSPTAWPRPVIASS